MKQILVELVRDLPIAEQMREVRLALQSGAYGKPLLHIFSGVADEDGLVRIARELADAATRI